MLPAMGGFKKSIIVAAALFVWAAALFVWGAASPVKADVVFRAECGSLKGHRVDMDPWGKKKDEDWKLEYYNSGPPPEGTGTLTFVSDDADHSHVTMKWSNQEQLLPIVFKSDTQITVADVDDFGVWLFTLYYRAGKVMVTRQTTNPGPGAIGVLMTGDCDYTEK